MWFKVESKRASAGQKFVVRCNSEIAGSRIVEERPAKGAMAARRTAEILASTLNVTATVYGTDAEGEFVYGVYEVAEGAAPRAARSSDNCSPNPPPRPWHSRISCWPTFPKTR
jgi:hypothetical protein